MRIALDESVPDHSTISRTRRLMDVETHQAVFQWVLQVLAEKKLLKGTTIGVDATTLEANAALRSIVRRDTGERYEEFLMRLAKESGIETPTREQLAKLDRKRPKKGSNDDWTHPHDPDARITKMKDGRTHLAHKAEHAVDMETGAIVAVTLHGADVGDTATIPETVAEAGERITSVVADTNGDEVVKQVSTDGPREVVTDKGYHSRALVSELTEWGLRTYCSEPNRGRQRWRGRSGNNKRCMRIGGAFAESEASGCYASAARSWSDGINTCMIGAGCAACICEAGKTFSSVWSCTRVRPISDC